MVKGKGEWVNRNYMRIFIRRVMIDITDVNTANERGSFWIDIREED